ncbi:DUF6377 domain-containing protein [Saccharicrinis aurantiacus]|uniref:DUF6377 domain-containing protein n=1 Tax=Saccharicrinis aurantiacus TaxID=1849719 RepID=UPI002491DCB7|nr:DUF6377 domain-containing protein [Saccharicrinis aurantiacus]
MKHTFLALCLLILSFNNLYPNNYNEALLQLDKLIENRVLYHDKLQERISNIKSLYSIAPNNESKYTLARQLCDIYSSYNIDSAIIYADLVVDYATSSNKNEFIDEASIIMAKTYLLGGMFTEADAILNNINSSGLSDILLLAYYTERTTQYRYLSKYTSGTNLEPIYNKTRIAYQDSAFNISKEHYPGYSLLQAENLIDKNKLEDAILILEKQLNKYDPKDRGYAFLSYTISRAYAMQSNLDKQKEYLALSASSDIYNAVRENVALHELALLLFQKGDINRAYKYIKVALDDALFSNARLRSFEVLKVMPVIDLAYERLKDKEKRNLILFSIVAFTLVTVLLVSLFFNKRQNNKLILANKNVKSINEALNDSNHKLKNSHIAINESNIALEKVNVMQGEYIVKYLKMCSSYIGSIDNYRLSLLKKTASSNTAQLLKILKSKEVVDKELQSFYNDFDRAFLDLHPDFISKFQALLRDDEQIILKQGELLNTELRIFALIRLGITESSQIAEFLRYSNPTIYNYRTKVRNKAKMDRDAFDRAVLAL